MSGLFISYWRSNYTKTVRIMRHEECATPSAVAEIALKGEELTDADVDAAEAKLAELENA